MRVLLDIGARNKIFVRRFHRNNKSLRAMFLCGEPDWAGTWKGEVRPGEIKCIRASYADFCVPPQSLDFVTLNAFNPLEGGTKGIEQELARTLKPGGFFFSAHPVGYHPNFESGEYLLPVTFSSDLTGRQSGVEVGFNGQRGLLSYSVFTTALPGVSDPFVLPASPTIQNRLRELALPEELRRRNSSYIYARSENRPSIRVWMRSDRIEEEET